MGNRGITITIDEDLLKRLDKMVVEAQYPSRSKVIEAAVEEMLARLKQTRLITELAKTDPEYEQALADEGLSQWDLD